MAYAVDLLVTFPSRGPVGVQRIAQHMCRAVDDLEDPGPSGVMARRYWPTAHPGNFDRHVDIALWFLKQLAEGRGFQPSAGRAWGRWVWSSVGNHVYVGQFVEILRPFWSELLAARPVDDPGWDGPRSSDTILLLYEGFRDWWANAAEIRSTDPASGYPELSVRRRERLPFTLVRADERPFYANLPSNKRRNCYGQVRAPEGLGLLAHVLWQANWKSGWQASLNEDAWDRTPHLIIGGDGIDLVTDPLAATTTLSKPPSAVTPPPLCPASPTCSPPPAPRTPLSSSNPDPLTA